MRTAHAPTTAHPVLHNAGGWLARRWYYTPRTRRAYSVRQIAPGDRRLLAELLLTLGASTAERELAVVRDPPDMLFDRVLAGGSEMAVGFAALEATAAGDRIVGVAAYAPHTPDEAGFCVAVAEGFRQEQVGRTLLATLTRHAKRVGIRRLRGAMFWANRAMQRLAESSGFSVEAVPGDRLHRALVLTLK